MSFVTFWTLEFLLAEKLQILGGICTMPILTSHAMTMVLKVYLLHNTHCVNMENLGWGATMLGVNKA
jgi:hypothetical protein